MTVHVSNQEVICRTGLSSIGDIISSRCLGLFGHVARLDSGIHARDALKYAYTRHTRLLQTIWMSKADLAAPD